LEQEQLEAVDNRILFGYSPAPPGSETLAELDRLARFFEAKVDLVAKERTLVGMTRKMTPEHAAVALFALEIEDLAGAPLDAEVLALLAPFLLEPIDDRNTLRRCRESVRKQL
jgi:hypothetical protein